MIDMPINMATTLAVTIQSLQRRGVYWDKTRFTKLGVSDDQSFRGDIVQPQSQGFRGPKSVTASRVNRVL